MHLKNPLPLNSLLLVLASLSTLQAQQTPDFGTFLTGGLWANEDTKNNQREEMQFFANGHFFYSVGTLTPNSDGSRDYSIFSDGDGNSFELTPPNILKIGIRDSAFKNETCIHYFAGYNIFNLELQLKNYLILVGKGGKLQGEYQSVIPLKNRFYEIDRYFGDVRFDSTLKKVYLSVMGVVAEMDFEVRPDSLVAYSQRGNVIQIFRQEFRGDTLFMEETTKPRQYRKQSGNPIQWTRPTSIASKPRHFGPGPGFNILGRRIQSGMMR